MNKIQKLPIWLKILIWLTATYLGLLISTMLPILVSAFFMSRPLLFDSPQGTAWILVFVGLVSLASMCLMGYVIGIAQWKIVQGIVEQKATRWVVATIIGVLLVTLEGFITQTWEIHGLGWKFIRSGIMGSLLGFLQWFVLRGLVRKSAVWIGLSLLCWAIPDLAFDLLRTQNFHGLASFLVVLANPNLLSIFFGTILSALALRWFISRVGSKVFDSKSIPQTV